MERREVIRLYEILTIMQDQQTITNIIIDLLTGLLPLDTDITQSDIQGIAEVTAMNIINKLNKN